MKTRVNICGIQIDNVTMAEVMDEMNRLIQERKLSYIVTPNADHIVKLQKDQEFRRIYEDAALVLADGMSLIWAGMFLGTPLREKVSGSDLLPEFCRVAAKKGHRLFFLGGREGAAKQAKEVLEKLYPGIKIVGAYAPPMGFEKNPDECQKIETMIKEASPDALFVGLGAPKQERWIYNNYRKLNIPVSAGIGVSFEFMAGIVKRAPRWMCDTGVEWLWRLLMEPKRLWKRYLVEDPIFFWFVLQQKILRKT